MKIFNISTNVSEYFGIFSQENTKLIILRIENLLGKLNTRGVLPNFGKLICVIEKPLQILMCSNIYIVKRQNHPNFSA